MLTDDTGKNADTHNDILIRSAGQELFTYIPMISNNRYTLEFSNPFMDNF